MEQIGVYMRIFCDFGDEFVVKDRDGEQPAECFIKSIDHEKNIIELFKNSEHDIRENDHLILTELISKPEDAENEKLKKLNNSIHQIEDFIKFNIIKLKTDLSQYKRFERNGKIK